MARTKRSPRKRALNEELHLVISDTHIPFEDPSITELILGFVERYRPGTIHHLGDLLDFYQLSFHLRDPNLRTPLLDDLQRGYDYLLNLRTAAGTDATIHLTEGNHEYRLHRQICAHADELGTLPELHPDKIIGTHLGLHGLGIKWHNYTTPYAVGPLWFKHGSRLAPHSAYTARLELERTGASVIFGHTHRLGVHYKTQQMGMILAMENGCTCLIDPRVHKYTNGIPNWQHGFTVIQFLHGEFQAEQVSILRQKKNPGYIFHGQWHSL